GVGVGIRVFTNSAFKASFLANLHLRPPSVCYYEEANLEGRQRPTALPLYVSWQEQIKNREDTKKMKNSSLVYSAHLICL
ncbi:MAG: hypothetical protein NTX52_01955, partial [Planctomycetota bacterium]|nr:hypothetical protein [Planctomycetota bacterium]